MGRVPLVLLMCLVVLPLIIAVDHNKFRTCKDTDFCKRNRDLLPAPSVYSVISGSVKSSKDKVTADILNTYNDVNYVMELTAHPDRILRLKIDEKNPLHPRYQAKDVLVDTLQTVAFDSFVQDEGKSATIKFGDNRAHVKINYEPFVVELYVDDILSIVLNDRGLFNFEHLKQKVEPAPPAEVEKKNEEGGWFDGIFGKNGEQAAEGENNNEEQQPNEDAPKEEAPKEEEAKKEERSNRPVNVPAEGAWHESFGGFNDNKKNGPESIGLDIAFINSKHVYGLPEHSTGAALRNTKGDGIDENPYRLYNLDVFEYEIDQTMALYGSVPILVSHDAQKSVAVFWLNPSEMFIDVSDGSDTLPCEGLLCSLTNKGRPRKDTHWMAEAGVVDLFFMMGPSPYDIFAQYASLTGTGAMPQMFSIGYHQCRWNYRDEADVASVDSHFDLHNIPYDVLWLDIEHTDGKRYFTWDNGAFPNPEVMQDNIAAKGRKMVVIIDPHIKRDGGYHIHSEAQSKGLYVKDNNGNDYDGWCWPGSSSYLDFTEASVRTWWADRLSLSNYKGSTKNLYVWNDMNEPSVFNGPEVSMPKDAKHAGGWEHRVLHNMYGYYVHMATNEGLIRRHPEHNDRPFVLSRAFFAGTQRYGAIWTGDNAAQWSHLKASVPMILSLGLGGISFAGADVGGFFNNPDAQLQTRWYQLGAFYPFFRGHAHLDTKRREPWIFGEPYTAYIRDAIRTRYSLLPYWYTLFHVNNQTGAPLVRPLWVDFPKDESVFGIDDAFLVGSELLVKPVVEADQTDSKVYLPGDGVVWYDFFTSKAYDGAQTVTVQAPLDKIPVFVKGGSILPKKDRPRRSSSQMESDPFTLFVAADKQGSASGKLYYDDGHSFNFRKGQYELVNFSFAKSKLSSVSTHSGCTTCAHPEVERVVIVGVPKPSKVSLTSGKHTSDLDFEYLAESSKLTIRKPATKINSAWSIDLL